MLYYLPPVRRILIAHMSIVHTREYCLACELGFLFRMLDDSSGHNCHASNFLRAFSQFPQAGALGLLESDDVSPQATYNYNMLIQSFLRFLLDELHLETQGSTDDESESAGSFLFPQPLPSKPFSELFATSVSVTDKCQVCGTESRRETSPLVVDLPTNTDTTTSSSPRRSFTGLLELGLNRTTLTKAWCSKCNHYQHTVQTRSALSLPKVMVVNCGNIRENAAYEQEQNEKAQPFLPDSYALSLFMPLRDANVMWLARLTIYEVDGAQIVNPASPPENCTSPPIKFSLAVRLPPFACSLFH